MVAALICAVVQMRVSKLLRNAAENVSGLQSRPNRDFLVVGTLYRVDVLGQLLTALDGARCIFSLGLICRLIFEIEHRSRLRPLVDRKFG